MQTKSIGIVLIIIGIIMIACIGFNFVTTEKGVDIGPLEIEKKKNNPVRWSPVLGVVLFVGGVVVIVSGGKGGGRNSGSGQAVMP